MPVFFKDDKQRARIADYVLSSSLVSDFLNRDYVEKFVVSYDRESHEAGNWFWYKQNRAIQYFNLLLYLSGLGEVCSNMVINFLILL